MNNEKVKNVSNYTYLNLSKKYLDIVTDKGNNNRLKDLRKKFATAAIITLASGTTLLFSANSAKADSISDTNVKNNNQLTTSVVQQNGAQT